MATDWLELRDYIKSLLISGKRSQDPEFKTLMRFFTRDRVVSLAKQILKEIEREKTMGIGAEELERKARGEV